MTDSVQYLQLADWRRAVAQMYARVRVEPEPEAAHDRWRRERDGLMRTHPQSPLASDDPLRASGVPYFPYDPALRFEVPLRSAPARRLEADTSDGRLHFDLVGQVSVPELDVTLEVWWLVQYGGGLFLPVRDGTAGRESYGGGRYLLDTVKGADLGGRDDRMVIDFNFLYHPSCRYSPQWSCPLAPEGNTTSVAIRAGECLG